MNEGDSAGGGQQGNSPAPPAVPDRRSTIPTTVSIASLQTLSSTLSTSSSTLLQSSNLLTSLSSQINSVIVDNTSSPSSSFQQVFNQQLDVQNITSTAGAVTNSGSAVSSPFATNLNLSQDQEQHHMQSLRFATASNNNKNSQQQHRRIPEQIQQQPEATVCNSSYNSPGSINSTNNAGIVSIGEGVVYSVSSNVNLTSTSGGSSLTSYSSSLTASQSPNHSPLNKRIKLELPDGSSAGSSSLPTIAVPFIASDFSALKKRILEHKYSRIRSLKEKYSENVAELFYLQSGGNMMDYPTWRKKPPSPQFISFSNAYRLDQLVSEETKTLQNSQSQKIGQLGPTSSATLPSLITPSTSSSLQAPAVSSVETSFPQGAEIKIPSVGATPVAVSTQLPAAVVQLTQQGGTPLVPNVSSICENLKTISNAVYTRPTTSSPTKTLSSASSTPVFPDASINSSTPVASTNATATGVSHGVQQTLTTPTTATAWTGNGAGQEFSFKAKQEVYVMQRISELQREGLWTEKRLPKLQEPSRPKAHWDYLLEEMVWLAADFAQERKWKKNAAKKCSKMVQKYFQDKANAAQKAEKAQELHLKRIAAFISKEVKMFWSNVEKLVEYKHQTKLEEKRKKALDQHLSFIVDQTEKFSQQLAVGMNKTVIETSTAPSINSSRISSPKIENASDDEFRPSEEGSEDDEETIAKAEEEAADVNEEVAALEKESQMDLDDFLKCLPKDYLQNRDKIFVEEKKDKEEDEDDQEFQAKDEPSEDDENTISKQEADETDVDHKKELDELEADNELSVEKLLDKYKSGKMDSTSKLDLDSDDDEQSDISDDTQTEGSEDETNIETAESSASEDNDGQDGLKSLIEDTENKDDIFKDAAALAESIQPKGNTLSSTNVVTPVPFLLKHSLREYQHIGLDWLVTMHDRKLNGILADEMGLGKTIQTIALLAHLACVKGNWGPHLIVVPSSVMLNWEMEFKKWCPGFKILTYYGSQKERKLKRVGWTKPNAFHVCITSYKLVVQDQQSFRRKQWKYLILDEAQNIKNFKSQRWQLLLNFSTERRLLLTGTPLQNDLMELWSLMHFLMPYVFQSHREFKEWFSNPMTGMIEGNCEYNETLISRLHKVIRPFLLRRLKKEVEKQMPKKYEHIVMCRLSNRQRYLYEDFMSRAKTRETLSTGNFLSVINVLMQLRKVCNHPNLFEVRPTISPFHMEGIIYAAPNLAYGIMDYDPFNQIDLNSINLMLIYLEITLTAYVSHKVRLLAPQRKLIEEVDQLPEPPPGCPTGKYKFHIRIRDNNVQDTITMHSNISGSVKVGTSPAMKTEGNKLVPISNLENKLKKSNSINPTNPIKLLKSESCGNQLTLKPSAPLSASRLINPLVRSVNGNSSSSSSTSAATGPTQITKIVQMKSGKQHFVLTPAVGNSGHRITLVCKTGNNLISCGKSMTAVSSVSKNNMMGRSTITNKVSKTSMTTAVAASVPSSVTEAVDSGLVKALAQQVKTTAQTTLLKNASAQIEKMDIDEEQGEGNDVIFDMTSIKQLLKERRQSRLSLMARTNFRRCDATPIYGEDCRETIANASNPIKKVEFSTWQTRSFTNCQTAMSRRDSWTLTKILKSYTERTEQLLTTFSNFVIFVPPVSSPLPQLHVQHMHPSLVNANSIRELTIVQEMSPKLSLLHPIISAMNTQFPDPRLIQYDCGKLQTLDRLLRKLKSNQHRVLIFTQMTKMLDVLEAFLTHHGHIYLRLDGSTRIEQRQILMERFNGDKRIFVFILSTRSGGVGINLTGADTVIFYDSDWNPTMDAQAQDRCHRIGQTRDVHIYRLVSEKTIEVNILKKANQKRMLSDMAIEGGNFTTTFFKSTTIKDLFDVDTAEGTSTIESAQASTSKQVNDVVQPTTTPVQSDKEKQSLRAFESALANVEDDLDVEATKIATAEADADLEEFDETIPLEEPDKHAGSEMSRADLEVQNLVKQLSPIERYAMRFVEATGGAWTAEQLRAAEAEIEAQKREWEANRLVALQKEEEMLKAEVDADEMLTYSRKDAKNQVNNRSNKNNRSIKNIKNIMKNKKSLENNKKNPLSYKATVNNTRRSKELLKNRNYRNRASKSRNANVRVAKATRNNINARRTSLRNSRSQNEKNLKTVFEKKRKRTDEDEVNGDDNYDEGDEEETESDEAKDIKENTEIEKSTEDEEDVEDIEEIKPSPTKKKPLQIKANNRNQKVLLRAKALRSRKLRAANAKSGPLNKKRKIEQTKPKKNLVINRGNRTDEKRKRLRSGKAIDNSIQNDSSNNEDKETGVNKNSDLSDDESDKEHCRTLIPQDLCEKNYSESSKEDNESEEKVNQDYDKEIDENESNSERANHSISMDVEEWTIDAINQDTTTTNSTYYNVSDESDETDEDDVDGHDNKDIVVSGVKKKPLFVEENHVDVNSPRTRSRGSVKINLWTLDVSPILPGVKPTYKTSRLKDKTNNDANENNSTSYPPTTTLTSLSNETPKKWNKTAKQSNDFYQKNIAKARTAFKRPSQGGCVGGGVGESAKLNSKSTLDHWLLKKNPKVILKQIDMEKKGENTESSSITTTTETKNITSTPMSTVTLEPTKNQQSSNDPS